jgi:hypothetical protein
LVSGVSDKDECISGVKYNVNDSLKKYYNSMNDVWGKPQFYKGIPFFPLRLSQENQYKTISTIFTVYNRNISDAQLARMSLLKFLILVVGNAPVYQESSIENELIKILKFLTRQKDVEYFFEIGNENDINTYKPYFKIRGKKISEWDFENVRELILEQNNINFEHIKEYDPELEDSLIFINQGKSLSLPEYIFSFSAAMHLPIEYIREKYTMFQFYSTLERLQLIKEYDAFKALESAGFIKLKKGEIAHWLTHLPKKGRYDSILIPKEQFKKDNDIFKISMTK